MVASRRIIRVFFFPTLARVYSHDERHFQRCLSNFLTSGNARPPVVVVRYFSAVMVVFRSSEPTLSKLEIANPTPNLKLTITCRGIDLFFYHRPRRTVNLLCSL